VNDTVPTKPTPTERLLAALDPADEHDLGLAVVICQDLPADTATVLAELVNKRVARGVADAYDRCYRDRAEGTVITPGDGHARSPAIPAPRPRTGSRRPNSRAAYPGDIPGRRTATSPHS
jgi:hypothetical protein